MLPKKPKREDCPLGAWGDICHAEAERDYYKAVAEFAVSAIEKALISNAISVWYDLKNDLEAIRQTEIEDIANISDKQTERGNFVAIKKHKDGYGEAVHEYFKTREACENWIDKQKQPKGDEFKWMIGSYDL